MAERQLDRLLLRELAACGQRCVKGNVTESG
jgi:hypothetical protein